MLTSSIPVKLLAWIENGPRLLVVLTFRTFYDFCDNFLNLKAYYVCDGAVFTICQIL